MPNQILYPFLNWFLKNYLAVEFFVYSYIRNKDADLQNGVEDMGRGKGKLRGSEGVKKRIPSYTKMYSYLN